MSQNSTPLRLLQITDTHLFADPQARLYGACTRETLQAVLAQARTRPAPDLVLVTGDLVHDGSRQGYAALASLLAELRAPACCLPGNHDLRGALAAIAGERCQVGGCRALGGWRLILLDSTVAGEDHGRLAPAQLQALAAALQKGVEPHVLIALHHPPVPLGSRWLDRIGLQNAVDFFAVLEDCPRVRVVVWGHAHQVFESERRGVRLLGAPSTCVQFLPGAARFALDTRPPGMRWLSLYADGRIETEIEWLPAARGGALTAAG